MTNPNGAADREEQAQLVARAEERTDLNYEQRQTLWALGRILLAGQSLSAAQEAAIERLAAGVALPLKEQQRG
jgi:hypothetical protein